MKSAVWDANELANIQNKDRLLPSQPMFTKMYKGDDFYGDMERLLGSMYEPLELDIKTKEGVTYAVLGSDLNTLQFYQFLIRSHGYEKILELGTYIGVSTMHLMEAVRKSKVGASGTVTTVEKGDEFYWLSKENFTRNKMTLIRPIHKDAVHFLKYGDYAGDLNERYDFILIDCAKESYKELLELSLNYLTDGGMILVDDVFFQGDTLNGKPTSEKGKGVRAMLDYAATLEDWEKVVLPIGNGLLMVRKK